MWQILPSLHLGPKLITSPLKKKIKSCVQLSKSHQKFEVILENKVVLKKLEKNYNYLIKCKLSKFPKQMDRAMVEGGMYTGYFS